MSGCARSGCLDAYLIERPKLAGSRPSAFGLKDAIADIQRDKRNLLTWPNGDLARSFVNESLCTLVGRPGIRRARRRQSLAGRLVVATVWSFRSPVVRTYDPAVWARWRTDATMCFANVVRTVRHPAALGAWLFALVPSMPLAQSLLCQATPAVLTQTSVSDLSEF